jgi:hypothetical protein
MLDQQIGKLDGAVQQAAEQHAKARLLMTQPGVGPSTALTFVPTIGDVSRFRRKQMASYLGLIPWEESSGGGRSWARSPSRATGWCASTGCCAPRSGRIDGWGNEFHGSVIHGEISRVLVLSLLGELRGADALPGDLCADTDFALIEGHPRLCGLLLIGYLYGITSERRLVEELSMHLPMPTSGLANVAVHVR